MDRWQQVGTRCLVLGLLLTLPALAFAQSATPMSNYEKAMALVEQGRLREAEPILEDAVEQGRFQMDTNSAEFQRWLNSLGNVYINMGKANKAKTILDEAVAIGWDAKKRPETVLSLSYRGMVVHRSHGEAFVQQAISLATANFGPNDLRLAQPLAMLALIYSHGAHCKKARPLIEHALRIAENSDETYHVERGKRHVAMIVYLQRCEWDRPGAAALMEVHLRHVRKYLPSIHPSLASAYFHVGMFYQYAGRLDAAKENYLRAKAAGEISIGPYWWIIRQVDKRLRDISLK